MTKRQTLARYLALISIVALSAGIGRAQADGRKTAAASLPSLDDKAASINRARVSRQAFAAELTRRMSYEIYWMATGADTEILAGFVNGRVTARTIRMQEKSSPLWMELYKRGFRVVDINDNMVQEHAATLTSFGALPAVNETTLQKAYIGKAFSLLMFAASGSAPYPIIDPAGTRARPQACAADDVAPTHHTDCLSVDTK